MKSLKEIFDKEETMKDQPDKLMIMPEPLLQLVGKLLGASMKIKFHTLNGLNTSSADVNVCQHSRNVTPKNSEAFKLAPHLLSK